MLRRAWWMVLVVGLTGTAATVRGAETGLDALPEGTAVVLRLKSPQATTDAVAAFAGAIDPAFGQQAKLMSGALGLVISNPALAGVDKADDWFVAVFPKVDGEPGVAFVVPATDAAAMEKQVGGRFKFSKFEKWGVYTEDATTADRLKTFHAGGGKSIAGKIDPASRKLFDAGQISLYVNATELKAIYKQQFEQAGSELDNALAQLGDNLPPVEGIDLKPIFDMYGKMAKGILKGVQDTDGFTLVLNVDKTAVSCEEYVALVPGSETAKSFADGTGSDMSLLTKLPAGQLGYVGFRGDTSGFMKWALEISSGLMKGTPESKKNLETAMKEFLELKMGTVAGSFSLGKLDQGSLRSVTITEITPGDKARDVSRRMAKSMGTIEAPGIKQEIEYKEAAEKYGPHEADVMVLRQTFDENLDPLGIQKQIMQALYGTEGMNARTVYLPDRMVQTGGGGKDAMQQALDVLDKGNPPGPGVDALAAIRAKLPAQANLVIAFDLPGMLQTMARLVVESGKLPIPIKPEQIDSLGIQRSYLGFAAACEPGGLRMKTHVPVEQVGGVVKLVMMGMALIQQKPDL